MNQEILQIDDCGDDDGGDNGGVGDGGGGGVDTFFEYFLKIVHYVFNCSVSVVPVFSHCFPLS